MCVGHRAARLATWIRIAGVVRTRSRKGRFGPSMTPGRYELIDGHPVYRAATGGDGASRLVAGVQALASEVYASLRRAILDRLDGRGIERSEALRGQIARVIDPLVLPETLARASECASEADLVDGLPEPRGAIRWSAAS